MGKNLYILVKFTNGKPSLAVNGKSRSFTRKGSAQNYIDHFCYHAEDIRILSVSVPTDGPVGDGLLPDLVPELAVKWA